MIYSKLIQLIENNADELSRRLCRDVFSREETKAYRKFSEDLLCDRVFDVYSRLGMWLSKEKQTGEVERYYTELGKKRYREGIPLNEVVLTFMLIKRYLWLYVREKHFFDSTYECYQALEMNNKVVLFFDRVIFIISRAYEEELRKEQRVSGGLFSRIFKK
ncbi:MAG TPA: hypothetical protein ENN34_08465 [Deltaproteobacteria bacterium]|nr:hypothetical protein [Deltaproteobacteria bacterium]